MDSASPRRRRHVWVTDSDVPAPGLVLDWRRSDRHLPGWEAQVAVVRGGAVLVTWVDASHLQPVADDHWA